MKAAVRPVQEERSFGVVWIVVSLIFGAGLAFLAAAFDGIMAFGSSFDRFKIVFLICWPLGTLISYVAIADFKQKWSQLKNPSPREPINLNDPKVIAWIAAIVILGLLALIFGDFSLTP